jgi:hypothetical protein
MKAVTSGAHKIACKPTNARTNSRTNIKDHPHNPRVSRSRTRTNIKLFSNGIRDDLLPFTPQV